MGFSFGAELRLPPQSARPKREETHMFRIRPLVVAATLCVVGAAWAQNKPATPAPAPAAAPPAPAPADEPGWAKGRPKTDVAMKMAPVPAFPVPTPADQLPTKKFKLPPGFKVETWASGILD